MSNVSISSLRSWSDVVHALRAQAEAHRGSITLSPDTQDAITFPRTTGQDVLAISVVVDAAVRAHASSHALQRWLAESDLIAHESPWTLADTYVGNRSYWATLAAVAMDLDRVHAALPPAEVWSAAMDQLAAERGPLRNAAGAMLITLFTAPTWTEMVFRQLDLFRVLRGELETEHPVVPIVPRTCNADVLELARYWTEQLARIGSDPNHTHHRLVYAGWPTVLSDVIRFAKDGNPRAVYVSNVQFWAALVLLGQSDACDEEPAPWAFQVPPIDDAAHPRNAAPVAQGTKVEFPAAKTWEQAAKMQRDYFSKLRGEDLKPDGLIRHIPRTTIGDVRQVAVFWHDALRKVGEPNFRDISHRTVLQRWRTAAADVDAIPPNADTNATYANNTAFWTAVMTLAIQLAVTDETPGQWSIFLGSVGRSFVNLPETIGNLPSTISDVAKKVLDATKEAARDAVGKPLLYAGGAIAGGLLLYWVLRRRESPQRLENPS